MENTRIATPITQQPKIRIAADLLEQIETDARFLRQVIVHCEYYPYGVLPVIRIWPSTFLRDTCSDFKSQLITAYNISFYPVWGKASGHKKHRFTLVFGGLPAHCTSFDLLEDIPEPGGFKSGIIQRNKEDVYHVRVH